MIGSVPAAAAAPEVWEASSTTASSITGDLRVSDSKIIFGNKSALAIERVPGIERFDVDGASMPATVYRAIGPSAPRLLHGNGLCGGGTHIAAATYVVMWHPKPIGADEAPRSMAVFSGQDVPMSDHSTNLCGVYNYDLVPPAGKR